MRSIRILGLVLALGALGATALTAWQGRERSAPPPRSSEQSSAVLDLVYARPFRLERAYTHWFRRERPLVDAGFLLVLDVDPKLAAPRQLEEPVLYVGSETAERVNHGHPSGRVVAIVPAPRGADGWPALDLESAAMWFGEPALPEQIGAAELSRAIERAAADGVRPLGGARVRAALENSGGKLELEDKTALERFAAELVLRYAPGEEDLAQGILVPLSR